MSSIYICKQCLRSFKDLKNYKEHCFKVHQLNIKEKHIFKCSLCSYNTLIKSRYYAHMTSHLNNQIIRCSRCDFSTINKRDITSHNLWHRSNFDKNDIYAVLKNNNNFIKENTVHTKKRFDTQNLLDFNNEQLAKKQKILKSDFQNNNLNFISSIVSSNAILTPMDLKKDELKNCASNITSELI